MGEQQRIGMLRAADANSETRLPRSRKQVAARIAAECFPPYAWTSTMFVERKLKALPRCTLPADPGL